MDFRRFRRDSRAGGITGRAQFSESCRRNIRRGGEAGSHRTWPLVFGDGSTGRLAIAELLLKSRDAEAEFLYFAPGIRRSRQRDEGNHQDQNQQEKEDEGEDFHNGLVKGLNRKRQARV